MTSNCTYTSLGYWKTAGLRTQSGWFDSTKGYGSHDLLKGLTGFDWDKTTLWGSRTLTRCP